MHTGQRAQDPGVAVMTEQILKESYHQACEMFGESKINSLIESGVFEIVDPHRGDN